MPDPSPSRRVLVDRYEILGKLGQGGMGVVYRARDLRLGWLVAVKGLPPADGEAVARFRREARVAADLNHPHIVQVYDVETDGDQCFLTMELVDGGPLTRSVLPPRRAVEAILQAAEGLQFAHDRGVVHRDIKPDNLLEDSGGRVRIADFGLAREVKGPKLSRTGAVLGTPAYMSPEQARGESVDARSDQYSLGATLHALVTGSPPFEAVDVHQMLAKVIGETPAAPAGLPKDLRTILLKSLEKDPRRRYGSVREMAADLRAWLEGRPISARPPGPIHRFRLHLARRRGLWLTGVAAAIAAAGLAGMVWIPKLRAREAELAARARLKPLEDAVRDARPYLYIEGFDNLRAKRARVREALEALRKDPDLSDRASAMTTIGMAHHFLGDDAEAERALVRAVRLDPRDGTSTLALGRLLMERAFAALITGRPDPEGRREVAAQWGKRALEALSGPATEEAGLDRALAEAYRAAAANDAGRLKERCREGLERFGDGVGTEEFHLLRSTIERDPIPSLDRALKRRPHYAAAALLRSVHREGRGDLEGALADVESVIRLAPGSAEAHNNRGLFLWAKGDPRSALVSLDEAIRLDGRLAAAYANRADVRRLLGDPAGAQEDARKALDLYPRFAQAHAALAGIWIDRDDSGAAATEIALALEIDPQNAAARFHRGVLRLRGGEAREALADFDALVEAMPAHRKPAVLRARAEAKGKLGDFAGALRDLDAAIAADPRHPNAHNDRGAMKLNLGDLDGGIADFDRELARDPRHAEALKNRGAARRGKGLLKEARADLDLAIEVRSAWPEAWVERGAIRRAAADLDGALDDCGEALRIRPGFPPAHYGRGLVHLGRGELEKAIAEFSRAIDGDPKYADAYVNRGTARGMNGDRAGHLDDFRRALEAAPADWPHRAALEQAVRTLSSGS